MDGSAPQQPTLPYAALTFIQDIPIQTHSGRSETRIEGMQVSVFEKTYLKVSTLCETIRTAIEWFQGDVGTIHIQAIIRDDLNITRDDDTGFQGAGTYRVVTSPID